MAARGGSFQAEVLSRTGLSPHLLRLELGGPSLSGFVSTGIVDEWVGLVVPGQYANRFYTVRAWDGAVLTLDVVLHEHGLVTEWAAGDCVGDTVTITAPKGSFSLPSEARWVYLVGDLTALPALARAAEELPPGLPVRIWAEAPAPLGGYFPAGLEERGDLVWAGPGGDGTSRLAALVEGLPWPDDPGYFWMAGESSQMRAIRSFLLRERRLPHSAYDVMGYWRAQTAGSRRAAESVTRS
ncbi:siderophore-interacting protein [Propionicicella superfundia]|uniref:siderophore-interacting protein n=1 Tax=Propionicicella superfundia TaxID=348582 RepID=UPI0004002CBE|nr:siderophore-interacting protein [Propionicicella superfundia]